MIDSIAEELKGWIIVNARFLTQKITGIQRCAIEISKRLKKSNLKIKFLAPSNIIYKDLKELLEVENLGSLTGYLWEQIELPKYLRSKGKPLLVNLANTAPLFYKNNIVVIHDLAFLRNPGWFSKEFYYYCKFLIPKIARKALKIIVVSEFTKREAIKLLGIPESKIEVIYNAVSESFLEKSKKDYKNEYGNYILAVSSLDPRKNFKNLILAFNKLNLGNANLVIAGSGDRIFANKEIKNLISTNPNIIFTGYAGDEKLVGLYKNAKLFVYPSFYEGFGLPPLEAMSCGCPVVTSNVASLPEVCGEAAYYVNPQSIDDIARGIFNVLKDENLRKLLIEKGFRRIKIFSWEDSVNKYLKIIQDNKII